MWPIFFIKIVNPEKERIALLKKSLLNYYLLDVDKNANKIIELTKYMN